MDQQQTRRLSYNQSDIVNENQGVGGFNLQERAFTSENHLHTFRIQDWYLRILRPQWNALLPESDHLPRPLRTALDQLDAAIRKLHEEAALAA